MSAPRVAVVGAGLAGLAAAMELKEAGARVDLYERSRLLGGRATSFEIDGIEVDNGQHVFLGCCTEFVRFVQRAGMGEHLHLQERFDALVLARDGTTGRLRASSLPAPLHLATSFLTYKHLSLAGKLKIATVILSGGAKRRSRRTRDVATFADWLDATGQTDETRRGFWDPFFIPALNAPFDKIANEDAMFVLETAFKSEPSAARFGFSKVPLAHVAAAAAARCDEVHLSRAVMGVERAGEIVRLTLLDASTVDYDAVVLAVTPKGVAKILGDPKSFGVESLDAFDPYPIVDVHLWHDAGSIGFDFAAALDSPLQWIFEKAPGYICCSFSAADEYLRKPAHEIEAFAWEEVRAFVKPLANANLVRSAVTRNPEATYLARPGTARPAQRTNDPAIAIAGAWTDTGWPDTMESAVRSGISAASVILSGSSKASAVEGPVVALSGAREASAVEGLIA